MVKTQRCSPRTGDTGSVEDQSELHAAVVGHGRERHAANAAVAQDALGARRSGRSDHVAALLARRAALEAEISAIRAQAAQR